MQLLSLKTTHQYCIPSSFMPNSEISCCIHIEKTLSKSGGISKSDSTGMCYCTTIVYLLLAIFTRFSFHVDHTFTASSSLLGEQVACL